MLDVEKSSSSTPTMGTDRMAEGASDIADFVASQVTDSPLDAFRHGYAAALIAARLGENAAKVMGDYHEYNPFGSVNTPEQRAMDNYNNGIGAKIGAENSGKSDEELYDLVYDALLDGWFQVSTTHKPLPYGTDSRPGSSGGDGMTAPEYIKPQN